MDIEAAKKYIAVIERALVLLKQAVEIEGTTVPLVEEAVSAAPVVPAPDQEFERHKAARNAHIQSLMNIDCWPVAVPPHQMKQTMSEEDQINRANAVLDMMLMKSIEKKHFLDFGCGDGWIARDALKRGVASSTGYDPKPQEIWGSEKMKNVKFVTNFNDLQQQKYDVVVLYDVLDHVHDPMSVMNQIKHVLSKDGIVYVRCHPWTSKHASHLYKKGLNKAYIHLFLTWDELSAQGFEPMFTRPEKKPLEAYRWWFHDFTIERERPIREGISEFFSVPSFVELILSEQGIPKELKDNFFKDMEVQFVDFVLKP